MSRAPLGFGLFLVAAVAGCEPSPVSTEPEPPGAPSLEAAQVFHFREVFLFGIIDEAAGLSGIVGARPEEVADICADPDFPAYDEKDALVVLKPHSGAHKMTFRDREEQYIIWDGVPAPDARISCTFQGVTPLAVGTLHSIETNSNVFDFPAPGATVWHYRATGFLTNPVTGERYHTTVTQSAFTPPHGESEFGGTTITLKPVGGP